MRVTKNGIKYEVDFVCRFTKALVYCNRCLIGDYDIKPNESADDFKKRIRAEIKSNYDF